MPPNVAEAIKEVVDAAPDGYRLEMPSYKDCLPLLKELTPLMAQCWQPHLKEIGLAFDPDWAALVRLLADGRLILFTARKDGKIVGYQMWTMNDYYMSKGVRAAFCHRIFGGSKLGVDAREFVRFALNELKHHGVRTVVFAAQAGSAAERVYLDVGAKPQETLFGMDLWRQ